MTLQIGLKSWLVGCTMLAMTASGAFAEVVFNRGNSADPESLDPHKTSTVYEAQYPARPVHGSDRPGRQGQRDAGCRRKLDGLG